MLNLVMNMLFITQPQSSPENTTVSEMELGLARAFVATSGFENTSDVSLSPAIWLRKLLQLTSRFQAYSDGSGTSILHIETTVYCTAGDIFRQNV